MTMAAEIKNRVGPPAAAQPGAAGNLRDFILCLRDFLSIYKLKDLLLTSNLKLCFSGVKIDSKPVEAKSGGGCC